LRDIERDGRARETAELRDADEVLELFQVHGLIWNNLVTIMPNRYTC
jgi:hypothetical protein